LLNNKIFSLAEIPVSSLAGISRFYAVGMHDLLF